jgi:lipid-A-disaccharide synthase
MFEDWRPFLYYPLGILPSVFFTLRMLLQWYQSERKKESYVSKGFWRLSLAGNLLLLLHYFIQVQYPFALLQTGNAIIAWRNLNLMGQKKIATLSRVFLYLGISAALVTLAFLAQSYFVIGEIDWIRTPTKLWDTTRQYHHISWHILGSIGGILFASRLWIQWWQIEQSKKSELGPIFWWLSISGSILSLIYFIRIQDVVSIIHFSFGLIPYVRNLMLLRTKKQLLSR